MLGAARYFRRRDIVRSHVEGRAVVTSAGDFRDLRAVVAQPRDADGELLIRCLQRSGVRVECIWPPPTNSIRT
jgi:hypothetical protein